MSGRTKPDTNKTLVRALSAAGDRGDTPAIAELVVPHAVEHDPAPGAGGPGTAFATLTGSAGELTSHVGAIVADGDRVAAVRRISGLRESGTTGEQSGRATDTTTISWVRIDDGQVTEHWGLVDTPSLHSRIRGCGGYTAIPAQRSGERLVPLGSASSAEENKSFMRSAMELLDSGEIQTFCALVHGHCVNHGGAPGRAGWLRRLTAWLEAFSDAEFIVLDQLAESDLVSGRYEFSARHTGEFAGIKPTGRAVSVLAMDMARIRDGQIVEHWLVVDIPSLLRQLD